MAFESPALFKMAVVEARILGEVNIVVALVVSAFKVGIFTAPPFQLWFIVQWW